MTHIVIDSDDNPILAFIVGKIADFELKVRY